MLNKSRCDGQADFGSRDLRGQSAWVNRLVGSACDLTVAGEQISGSSWECLEPRGVAPDLVEQCCSPWLGTEVGMPAVL